MNAAEQVLLVWSYIIVGMVAVGALWAAAICAAEFHRKGRARVRRACCAECGQLRPRGSYESDLSGLCLPCLNGPVEEMMTTPPATTRSLP